MKTDVNLLTAKTRYLLTSITWPNCGLKFRVDRNHMFFFKLTADQVLAFGLDFRVTTG